MHVLPLRRFVAGTLVFLFPLTALAATRTWDAGGSDNNWSTAANWSDDTVPLAGDIALFDGTGQTDVTINAASSSSGGTLQTTSSFTGSILLRKNFTLHQNLLLSGGTLDMRGSGNFLNVKGNWVNDGAAFRAGTGTVLLTGSGSSYTLKESDSFHKLYIEDPTENGLVGYWKFDEMTGLVTQDSSEKGNVGTLTNGTVWSGSLLPTDIQFANYGALAFDGSNDYVAVADHPSLQLSNTMTISSWIRTTKSSGQGIIVSKYASGGSRSGYILSLNNGKLLLEYATTATSGYVSFADTTTTLSDGQMHHVAVVFDSDADRLRFYADGTQVAERTATLAPLRLTNVAMRIGLYNVSTSSPWRGLLDDVRIYNRALSANEIVNLSTGRYADGDNGTETFTLGSALNVEHTLLIAAGILDASSNNYGITASGSLAIHGGFIPRSATITLNGIGTILKVYGASIYNLAIATGKSAILRAAATVTNALTLAANTTLTFNGHSLTATLASISNSGIITEGTGAILHTSSLSASPSSLDIGSSIAITLTDSDANLDGTARETVTVTANGETITLTETTNTSGIFQGSVSTAHGAGVASNGIIENNDACSFFVNIVYADLQDGTDSATAQVTVTDAGVVPCEIRGGGGGRRGSPGRGGVAPMVIDRTIVPSSPPEEPPTMSDSLSLIFIDVPVSAWFSAAVQELASLDIISGYNDAQGNALNRFGPADPVTFAEAMKMTLGVSGTDIPQGGIPTVTALQGHWSAAYLSYAQTLGLSLFPTAVTIDAPISRGKLAQLLVDILQPSSSGDEISFTDVSASHDHATAIRIVSAQGWMMGDTDANGALLHRFRPDDTLNRAEVAQVLVRVLR